MVERLLIILFLFVKSAVVFSQDSGTVTYKHKVLELSDVKSKTEGESAYQNVVKLAGESFNGYTSELKINKEESFYSIDSNLQSDDTNPVYANLATTLFNTNRRYYHNSKSKISIIDLTSYGERLLVKYDSIPYNWNVTTDKSNILGYDCFKAETYKTIQNPKGKFKFKVVVWFTPEIPFQTGPEDYVGLPGLVLKASYYSNIPYEIEAIKIKANANIEIDTFETETTISLKEYQDLNKKQSQNFKNYIDN